MLITLWSAFCKQPTWFYNVMSAPLIKHINYVWGISTQINSQVTNNMKQIWKSTAHTIQTRRWQPRKTIRLQKWRNTIMQYRPGPCDTPSPWPLHKMQRRVSCRGVSNWNRSLIIYKGKHIKVHWKYKSKDIATYKFNDELLFVIFDVLSTTIHLIGWNCMFKYQRLVAEF